MEKLSLQIRLSRLNTSGAAQRCLGRWGGLLLLTVFLLAATGGGPRELEASGIGREIAIGIPATGPREVQRPRAVHDPTYDHFVQRFRPLRADVARRRYLVTEMVTAAIQNRIDPDLLFALVAVESNFNSAAVSQKGARGLGQIMFATGRTVAPMIVHEPEDLYSVPRNLQVTALYLRRLLIERDGDLREALTAYHTGSAAGHLPGGEDDQYVDRICRHFAALKTKRQYRELIATASGDPATVRH